MSTQRLIPSEAEREAMRGQVNDLLKKLSPLGSKQAAFAALDDLDVRAKEAGNASAAFVLALARVWLEKPTSVFP